jgi:hypothetical protein
MDKVYIVYSAEENSYPNFYGAYRTRQEAECVAKTHPNHTYINLEIEEINIKSFDITPYKYHRYDFTLFLKSKGDKHYEISRCSCRSPELNAEKEKTIKIKFHQLQGFDWFDGKKNIDEKVIITFEIATDVRYDKMSNVELKRELAILINSQLNGEIIIEVPEPLTFDV